MIAMISMKAYEPNEAPKGFTYKILDTEGELRFRDFVTDPSTSYVQRAGGVIVCYDVTNRDSYNGIFFTCVRRDLQAKFL